MNPVMEIQPRGVVDDGTPERVVRTQPTQGDLVMLPFRNPYFYASASGTGSSVIYKNQLAGENEDKTASCIQVSIAPGVNSGGMLKFWVYGPRFGLRVNPVYGNQADLGVSIDGVATTFAIRSPALSEQVDPSGYADGFIANAYNLDLIASGPLDDDKHEVNVYFAANPDGLTTNYWQIWGYLSERRSGYHEFDPKIGLISNTVTLTSAQAAIPANYQTSNYMAYRTVRGLIYTNTDAGASHTVTIMNGSSVMEILVLQPKGTAGCSQTFDLLKDCPYSILLTHAADTSSVVNATMIGSV